MLLARFAVGLIAVGVQTDGNRKCVNVRPFNSGEDASALALTVGTASIHRTKELASAPLADGVCRHPKPNQTEAA
eukprot:2508761-Amphidinium_carterae.2